MTFKLGKAKLHRLLYPKHCQSLVKTAFAKVNGSESHFLGYPSAIFIAEDRPRGGEIYAEDLHCCAI